MAGYNILNIGASNAGVNIVYLVGLRRTKREDHTVHGDLANSAEFAGVATQSQRMKAESFSLFAKKYKSIKGIRDVIDYGFAAHDYNKARLNKATYKDLREKYSTLPFALLQTYQKYAAWKVMNAQLKITKNACYLNVQVEQPDPEIVEAVKSKYQYLRSKLQSKGTRSAKRKLQTLSGRERRFQKDVNHQIANWIVSKPFDVIALEDLTHIRNGTKNRKLEKWSFAEVGQIIEYKAAAIGKNVVATDPRYISRTCSRCGFQKKENRNGRTFKCIQKHRYFQ